MASTRSGCFESVFPRKIRLQPKGTSSQIGVAPVVLGILLLASPAVAQQAPNAGSLLRQQPSPPPPPAPPAQPFTAEPPAGVANASGARVLVKGVRVTGAKLIPSDELAVQLKPLVGKERSLADLQNGALALIAYYAQHGYLARVFLPPQEVQDGVIEYRVVEGARGAVTVDKKGRRIDADRVQRFIDARLVEGAPLDLRALGEAVNILNQQPGARVTAALGAGKAERDVDVTVTAQDRPLLSYTAGVNNEGSRGTGLVQGVASLTVANPTGRFDAASFMINGAEGSIFGRADYSIALGDRGFRLEGGASALRYKVVQDSLAALDAKGHAETAGLAASYPLIARGAYGLRLRAGFDGMRFVDRTVIGETSNRTLEVASLGLSGHRVQKQGVLAGVQTFGLTLVGGDVDENNAFADMIDQIGLRTQGGFFKLAWNVGLGRQLPGGWTFNGVARGQFADKNLDSAQRFSLGGPWGVRGYPVAEGTGDDGWIASLNLTRPVGENWTVGGFADGGWVKVNHKPLAGGFSPNDYTLASAGITADWRVTPSAVINATVAAPIGSNPGAPADGTNSDGSRRGARIWLGLSAAF
jgi:hemolysin activation/secretion protein